MPKMHGAAAAALFVALLPAPLWAQEEPYIEHSERHAQEEQLEAPDADPVLQGRWTLLASTMPINPVHVTLMHTGKVLVVAGSGNDRVARQFHAGEWDPATQTVRTFRVRWDMFCNGMVNLPDGRPFVFGGTTAYDESPVNFKGESRTSAYRPVQGGFVDLPRMKRARWYPTGTVLGDGTVMIFSGLDANGNVTSDVELYRPAKNDFVLAGTAPWQPPLYPRQHLLPSGKVFVSGAHPQSRVFDPATRAWAPGPKTIFDGNRDYGTSVLLPLTPANGFRPTVMILGGGHHGERIQATTELVDLADPDPAKWRWRSGPNLKQPRVQLNATILPNGKVLVSGGSTEKSPVTGVRSTELYDPATNTFSDGAPMRYPRLYHSNTLLLPDATVLAVGSNPGIGYQQHIEIYSPPYLFASNGGPAPRPAIASAPAAVAYGSTFAVRTPNAASIRSVVLIRPGAPTHAFDMEQRLVGMTFTAGTGVVNVRAPASRNLAPPGHYLLFLLDANGVPSIGRFVRLG